MLAAVELKTMNKALVQLHAKIVLNALVETVAEVAATH